MKLFWIKSSNGREKVKVDKSGGISFKWTPLSEKVQNINIKAVPVVRKVSARSKEDLKELEEMMKQLENMRKMVIKWSRV